MEITSSLKAVLHRYSPEQTERWRADATFVRSVLDRTGPLGRGVDAIPNQAKGQHFPEVMYAAHLIESEGIKPGDIFYENFAVSDRALGAEPPKAQKDFTRNNMQVIKPVVGPRFLAEMDRIFDLNPEMVGAKSAQWMGVDLFAIDRTRRRCLLIECKNYNPHTKRTETIQPQQLLTLAAAEHLGRADGPVFNDTGFEIEARLVVFVPEGHDVQSERFDQTISFQV